VTGISQHDDAIGLTVHGVAERPVSLLVRGLVGRHMALNAAAALVLLTELGVEPAVAGPAWQGFGGVARRFELCGTAAGVRVYDDYAHHPTEVRAQLVAAKPLATRAGGRLIGVFQPGTYSRTQTFATEFGQALAEADVVVLLDIFPAREEPIPGVTGALIAERVPLPADRVVYLPERSTVPARLAELAGPGDLILTMGIGDVYLLCPDILAALAERAT
jgi:UDP-N-acetylmuramate--alanine ligase